MLRHPTALSCSYSKSQGITFRSNLQYLQYRIVLRVIVDQYIPDSQICIVFNNYNSRFPLFAHSRSSFFFSFPVLVLGSSETTVTSLGTCLTVSYIDLSLNAECSGPGSWYHESTDTALVPSPFNDFLSSKAFSLRSNKSVWTLPPVTVWYRYTCRFEDIWMSH